MVEKQPFPTNFIIHQLYIIILGEYGLITKINLAKAVDKLKGHVLYFSKNRFMRNEFIFYKVHAYGCILSNEEIIVELKIMKKDSARLDLTITKLEDYHYSTLSSVLSLR